MTLTVKAVLGIVACVAIVFAGVAATLRLPTVVATLPGGLLFAMIVVLAVIAIAQMASTFSNHHRFWSGFFAACLLTTILSFSDSIDNVNTAPEHLAHYLWNLRMDLSDSSVEQATRAYALQRFVNLSAVLALAVLGGLVASRRTSNDPNDPA